MAKIDAFFNLMMQQKASDLHLASGSPPILRISGELRRVDYPPMESDALKAMLLVLWIALLGAVAASRDAKHIGVDVVSRWLPPRTRAGVRVLTDLFTVTVCVLLSWHAMRFLQSERSSHEMAFGALPVWVAQIILPIAFALIALRYLILLVHHLRQSLGREEIR